MRSIHVVIAAILLSVAPVARGGDPPTFREPLELVTTNTAATQRPLAIGDFDGDGIPDLLHVGADGSSSLLLRRGIGLGLPASTDVEIAPLASLNGETSLAWDVITDATSVLDLDGDGDLDILWHRLELALLNDGTGAFTKQSPTGQVYYAQPITTGNSALPDMIDVLPWYTPARMYLRRNRGDLVFEQVPDLVFPPDLGLAHRADRSDLADMNGDGKDDIIVSSLWNEFRVLVQTAEGGFETSGPLLTAVLSIAGSDGHYDTVQPGDFDGDGDRDVVVGGVVFWNDGTGNLMRDSGAFAHPVLEQASELHAVDVDNDLDDDLVFVEWPSRRLAIWLSGDGGFTAVDPIDLGLDESVGNVQLVVGDFEPDGRPDFAVGTQFGAHLVVLRQSGGPPPAIVRTPGGDAITPGVVRDAGPTSLQLSGTGFAAAATVDFGDAARSVAVTTSEPTHLAIVADFAAGVGGGVRKFEVRNPDGQRSRGEIELRSIRPALRRGRLKAVPEPARDRLELRGVLQRSTLSAVAPAESVAALRRDGGAFTLGDVGGALTVTFEPDDARWTERHGGRLLVWQTTETEFPRVKFVVNTRTGRFRMAVGYYDHPDATPGTAEMSVRTGDDFGREATMWRADRRGRRFRLVL